jgi:hypothetical protein
MSKSTTNTRGTSAGILAASSIDGPSTTPSFTDNHKIYYTNLNKVYDAATNNKHKDYILSKMTEFGKIIGTIFSTNSASVGLSNFNPFANWLKSDIENFISYCDNYRSDKNRMFNNMKTLLDGNTKNFEAFNTAASAVGAPDPSSVDLLAQSAKQSEPEPVSFSDAVIDATGKELAQLLFARYFGNQVGRKSGGDNASKKVE